MAEKSRSLAIDGYHGGTSDGRNDWLSEAQAPDFVIALDEIVTRDIRSVRQNEPTSKLARRSSVVVPHPEAGASVLGVINPQQ